MYFLLPLSSPRFQAYSLKAISGCCVTADRNMSVGRMIALGIKCRGECPDLGRDKLYAKPAGLTALDNDGYASFCCHEYPNKQGVSCP